MRTIACSVLLLILSACAHSTFEDRDDVIFHKPSGTAFTAHQKNWLELRDHRQENISPEIMGSLSYELNMNGAEWKPTSEIFILRHPSIANLKVVENRCLASDSTLKLMRTETVKISKKNKVILSTYEHPVTWEQASGGGSTQIKSLKALSLFATSEKDSNLVVMVTVEKESPGEKKLAMDFIGSILFDVHR